MNRATTRPGHRARLAVLLLLCVAVAGCALRVDVPAPTATANPQPATHPAPAPRADSVADVRQLIETLPVKGKGPKAGYSRSEFGRAWSDEGTVALSHNGCDQRMDVLQQQLTHVVTRDGEECIVESGILSPDPYTGTVIFYRRGDRPNKVAVDHVVPLALSWIQGAKQWSPQKRLNFATDPDNLLAVSASANSAKRDSDISGWQPKTGRCEYAQRIVRVKVKCQLSVTDAERATLSNVLARC